MSRNGGKLSFCNSYSGISNSPTGGKFLIGMSVIESFEREVTTVRSAPAWPAACVIARMVRATPLTSSSVSVNHARFSLRSGCGTVPVKRRATCVSNATIRSLLAERDDIGQHARADGKQSRQRLKRIDQIAARHPPLELRDEAIRQLVGDVRCHAERAPLRTRLARDDFIERLLQLRIGEKRADFALQADLARLDEIERLARCGSPP